MMRTAMWMRGELRRRAVTSLCAALIAALGAAAVTAMPGTAQEVGPANGALVIVGGGAIDDEIYQRFLALAGGADVPIVVIPTAGEDDEYDQYYAGLRAFKAMGATNLTVLHTRDRADSDTDAFVRPIREARAVWFPGGRQWRLADSYLGTGVQRELEALLARGGVIGGTSAGATILGDYLVRGDTRSNEIVMGDHEQGFAFLRGVAIDQHLLKRNRQFDMLELIEQRPDLLGIGIDESTAIVVQGDRFEVIGESYVVIYDGGAQLDSGGRFYFLAAGDRYDLAERQAFRPVQSQQPIARVVKKAWSGGEGP